ncbi:ATP-binding protein [Janthinobacterium kumbetense]|uniref:ATP-binding protein n=1 Tax=Janthinobacterium kumbetense TaxID=2950280 RepID=A0ABT0WJ57_9BURK|nr:ATP-binding protein [Janthinobacterium kumbetense]MCM2564101.1 ATP-binding protein [Janthinobacterium kumbetense]
MKPQIEFKHVLGELSVNRHDPCEVLRELVSNSYDANCNKIYYAPLNTERGFAFLDDGSGLSTTKKINGITPWEAFFSIGRSTKKKGSAIGYKCQGTKLCFACSRILVATKTSAKSEWIFKIIDNPRSNLDVSFDISPHKNEQDLETIIRNFLPDPSSDTDAAITDLVDYASDFKTGTLVFIDGLDTENYAKYFTLNKNIEESYVFNYIRFFTRHGDVRRLDKLHGFTQNQITQIASKIGEAELSCFSNKKRLIIPHGFPYLEKPNVEDAKSPAAVSRLRDGRFFSRAAKAIQVGGKTYSLILAIDGNRRAHEEYQNLDRKGKTRSGVRLGDQRGLFISVNGIKICKYLELLENIDDYGVLADAESSSHFCIIIDGEFDLVTNRNSLSKKAFDTLTDPEFLKEFKKFLDVQKKTDSVFSELISRLKKESTENKLNEQMEILETARNRLKKRERFRINTTGKEHLFLSPLPGEEYLVGVLYATLANMLPPNSPYVDYWKKIVTFSTQGIDSLGIVDESISSPLKESNVVTVEYKYDFNNSGPFNHALAVVDYIVAWDVGLKNECKIHDSYTCFGDVKKSTKNDFEWIISDIESEDGAVYKNTVRVICLKDLIRKTFSIKFSTPDSKIG